MKFIPYGSQYIDSKDIQSVVKTLKKDKITTGSEVNKFEKKISAFLKCKYSTTCNSGTSALYLSLLAINVKKNDTIIMPTINFVSSYNLAKILGANIYLADVDKKTGQMSPKNVDECCKRFNIKKVKAIIIMYNSGYPQNAEKFIKLKKKFKCFLIEDACHAFGAEYKFKGSNLKIGSCVHSDISTFSMHPLKTITTGEGGIVTTNSKKLDEKIKKIRSLGIQKSNKKHWEYDVKYPGFNFRLNDFQCSLGISQLNKVKRFLKYRKKIADKYNKQLKNIPDIAIPIHLKEYISSNHLYLINLKIPNYKKKEKLIKYMLKNKIILQSHYIPIYKFNLYRGKQHLSYNTQIYYNSTISLPIYYNLSSKEQNYIINLINKFFKSIL